MVQNGLKKCIHGVFIFMMLYIVFSITIIGEQIDYPCKRDFLWSRLVIFVAAGIMIFAVIAIFCQRRLQKERQKISSERSKKIVLCGCVIFTVLQIYASYNYYFLTDWDVDLIYQSAQALACGTFSENSRYGEFCWYYSTYPNNMELLGVFVVCLKINQFFGVLDPQNGIMTVVILNSVIMATTGYLLYRVISTVASYRWGLLGWIAFTSYVGLSPWVVIPYSDSLGLLFPVLELWIVIQLKSNVRNTAYLILLGIVGGIGYYLKPQVAIILIAALILFIIDFFAATDGRKHKTISLSIILVSFLFTGLIPKAIGAAFGIPIDENREFGMSHFVMMGMNPETKGVYSQEDCDFSHSFSDTTSRRDGEIQVIKDRLVEYRLKGYFKLLNQKLLTTYGDGSFAWGLEGSFWKEIVPEKNLGISAVLRDFYYNTGCLYENFLTYMQLLWVVILCLQLFAKPQRGNDVLLIAELSLIGLTLFELLFEARARYLYTYAPLYIFVAVCGLQNLKNHAQGLQTRIMKKG